MNSSALDFDVIVIGAGAAGLMCAAQAGRRGRRVLAIDHWKSIGERIRISGGGRCNFTNRMVSAANYLSRNPHFCRSALARFTPSDFVAMLDRHRIPYEERDNGQLFCTGRASDITRVLRAECHGAGVHITTSSSVQSIAALPGPPSPAAARFSVTTQIGTFRCRSLVVATGGLAAPALGATPLGYRLAAQFGLATVPTEPGLVPLSLGSADRRRLAPLSGLAFDARVSCRPQRGPHFTGSVLITHQGLSGPAILQASSYWQTLGRGGGAPPAITIDLLPGISADRWLEAHRDRKALFSTALSERLPHRFARAWCEAHGLDTPLNQMSRADLALAAKSLANWTLTPSGTLGFDKAEVTLGGVATDELSSTSMESRRVPGLFFVGEVVDVTGWLGGYNFQWAWSSGWAAGQCT